MSERLVVDSIMTADGEDICNRIHSLLAGDGE